MICVLTNKFHQRRNLPPCGLPPFGGSIGARSTLRDNPYRCRSYSSAGHERLLSRCPACESGRTARAVNWLPALPVTHGSSGPLNLLRIPPEDACGPDREAEFTSQGLADSADCAKVSGHVFLPALQRFARSAPVVFSMLLRYVERLAAFLIIPADPSLSDPP